MNASDVLRQAADIIDTEGWYNGIGIIPKLENGNPACLITSIYRAAGREHNDSYAVAIRTVENHIKELTGSDLGLATWNDHQASKDDVTALLRKVAEMNDGVTQTPQ